MARVRSPRHRVSQSGFSYVEVLVATVILAIALVPAVAALQTGLAGVEIHESQVVQHYRMLGKFEEVLAEPFGSLDSEALAAGSPSVITTYSDLAGSENRRVVFLARYDGDDADSDGDPFTGGDEGLLWVKVEIEGTAHVIETLVSQ